MPISLTQAKKRINGSTVLVTGGAGFIGSHLVDALLEYGARRIVVIDDLSRARPAWHGGESGIGRSD